MKSFNSEYFSAMVKSHNVLHSRLLLLGNLFLHAEFNRILYELHASLLVTGCSGKCSWSARVPFLCIFKPWKCALWTLFLFLFSVSLNVCSLYPGKCCRGWDLNSSKASWILRMQLTMKYELLCYRESQELTLDTILSGNLSCGIVFSLSLYQAFGRNYPDIIILICPWFSKRKHIYSWGIILKYWVRGCFSAQKNLSSLCFLCRDSDGPDQVLVYRVKSIAQSWQK